MKAGRSALLERTRDEAPRGRFTPTAGMAKLLGVLVVPIAVIATGVGVVGASYSSFSATTHPDSASNWATGSVALTNDTTAQTALFNAVQLKPTSTGTQCIKVTSSGTLPAVVKLYATGYGTTKELSSYINVTITQGIGGAFGSCVGFTPLVTGAAVFSDTLLAFKDKSSYANGLAVWTTAGGAPAENRTFQITYTLATNTPNDSQGGTAAVGFTWEAQNT